MVNRIFISLILISLSISLYSQTRMRDYGITYGIFKTGKNNAITDVEGVTVGQVTLIEGDSVRTGVTAIVPHQGNIFKEKVPAAIYIGNGFGKLAGYTQVKELGNIETPIILTNTLNVAAGLDALIDYTLSNPENKNIWSVNGVVGETNDGSLNDIQGRHVKKEHVLKAIKEARSGVVEEGNVGAGTGTVCFGYKGGIGTSSRVLPKQYGGYTVGVLVQSNYGGVLEIAGVPVWKYLDKYSFRDAVLQDVDGSCMMVVITDAPIDSRNLERVAKRAMMGLSRTGGIASNGSGDYVIALSVNKENMIQAESKLYTSKVIHNDDMSPLFEATIEATAEALWNSMFAAKTMKGRNGREVKALPVTEILHLFNK
ncbi:S58 family peptidase [Bacteroides sp. 214]|uniref:DmpA family aminopeptidase n=1 Tax=Bacteroides sp. 214 TaxID=2302935 RepID=UPI0013D59983|nr:P1 family peptidase [Bacteroides sp. 214]NDW13834.1 S58 family peptidase [Bacteroides sp. 214]